MKKNPGDTVSKYFYFKDKDETLFDPDATECKVVNPSGTETAVVLSKAAVGKYEFNYTLSDSAEIGTWKIKVKGTKNSYAETETFEFEVSTA